ncbi:peptidoglycan DD-metalloendopeptidase family protein [Enterococcus casseliflavus]|uniref:peptidoglycan DD-metalloendopeptidase family protein n=1 Tax=Enterococcus casseliflavus TaxID=37734 RepID=UPI002542EAE6|nr:peptidoglycan DD-metalloendopeptidase family protein [Enterococcus casseliflavus]MDK4450093.1 peptidoglycan DD-metalloendopeptidase family protein [Enterococcus casseliflavus]
MKHSQKGVALLLVCGQLLAGVPVSAAVVASESTTVTQTSETAAQASDSSTAGTIEETAPAVEGQVPDSEQGSVPVESVPEGSETAPEGTEQTEEPTPVPQPTPEPEPELPSKPEPSQPEEPTPAPKPEKPTQPEAPKPETQPEKPKPSKPVETKPTPEANSDASQETPAAVSPVMPPSTQPSTQAPSAPSQSDPTPQQGSETTLTVTPVKEVWDFIQEIGEDAREIGLKNDLYASVMIAQAILESGGGQSRLNQAPYFNLFGIKGTYQGQGVAFRTQEDDGSGNHYTITETFRQYTGYKESLMDYARLLKEGVGQQSDFYKGVWKSEAASYQEAARYLTGRYATDTTYDQKLTALIEAYALTRYDQKKPDVTASETYLFPVEKAVVTSTFGPRWGSFHRGVDFAAAFGTPILASQSGTVIRSDVHPSWGNYVAILHEDGMTTLYAHNQQNLVKVGQQVEQGETIALMGSTGNSTGAHLHFEVSASPSLSQAQLVDPIAFLTK